MVALLFDPKSRTMKPVFGSGRDSRVAGRAWMSLPGEPRVADVYGSPLLKMGCYPKCEVPGVKLGVIQ
jgi:hypothetical protein